VPQTRQQISAATWPKFTVLSGHVEEVLLINKFFFGLSIHALVAKISSDKVVRWCPDAAFLAIFFSPAFPASHMHHISSFSSSFFSSPNISRCELDVCHTSTHGVALVRIYDAGLKPVARGSLKTQDAKNRHLGTIAQLCWAISSQLRHVSTIGKKLVLHMSPQYGDLWPTNGWDWSGSLRHPCKFQRVSRLGSITARHLVVGVSQTLLCWTEGATYVRQGNHHVGHWPTF